MAYIIDLGRQGDTKRYEFDLAPNPDRVIALVSKNGACLKIGATVLDRELTDLVLQELRENVKPGQASRANEILQAFQKAPIYIERKLIPFDSNDTAYARVRHYTTQSRARKIAEDGQFGGPNAPRPLDQGKVFVEKADGPLLSQQDFANRYAITDKDLGAGCIEFLAPESDLETQICQRNSKLEYFLRAKEMKDGNLIYKVISEIQVVR